MLIFSVSFQIDQMPEGEEKEKRKLEGEWTSFYIQLDLASTVQKFLTTVAGQWEAMASYLDRVVESAMRPTLPPTRYLFVAWIWLLH